MNNPFFKNKGPFKIDRLLKLAKVSNKNNFKSFSIKDIKDLSSSSKDDITFFHSRKYEFLAKKTKASFCLTTENLKVFLPRSCKTIVVTNVLIDTAKITEILYPDSVNDHFDNSVKEISKTSFKKKINYGINVLIGKNVRIGKNCSIGHNSIIEKNVVIGNNCSIGSNTIIRNTILKNNVNILDGCVLEKKDLVFFQIKLKIIVIHK